MSESPVLTATRNVDQRRTNPDSSEHSSQQKAKDAVERPTRFDQPIFQDLVVSDMDVPFRNNLKQMLANE